MERSQSYSSFISNNLTSDNNNNITQNISTPTTVQLLQAIEMRQMKLQQQQQQKQMLRQKSHYGSSDAINAHPNNTVNFINYQPMRQHLLQRQKSAGYMDDMDYAADLEEEEEDDEHERTTAHIHPAMHQHCMPHNSNRVRPPFIKQLQLQKRFHSKTMQESPTSPPPLSSSSFSSTSSSVHSPAIPIERRLKHEESFDSIGTSNSEMSPINNRRHQFATLMRDNSIHSDSSRYSSVDSLLESRKPDPEAILINLGFGPVGSEDILSRIPKRFLKPSQVRGIDTEAFVKRLQLANNLADHSVLGYRGLTGNPDVPPSTIVAKIMQRFEVNERKKSMGSLEHTIR